VERFDDLAGLSVFASARDLIRAHRGRVRLHLTGTPDRYRCDVLVSAKEALAFYDHRVSMNLEMFEATVPLVGCWLDELSDETGVPRHLCFCSAFISQGGQGLPLHFDNKEVIAVQVAGRKRWLVAMNTAIAFPTANFTAGSAFGTSGMPGLPIGGISVPDPEHLQSVNMEPGSVLFLPRGYWHGTQALENSISLSFGFALPSWAAVFADRLKAALLEADHWRAPAVRMIGEGGAFLPEDMVVAMDRAITDLLSGDMDQFLRAEMNATNDTSQSRDLFGSGATKPKEITNA